MADKSTVIRDANDWVRKNVLTGATAAGAPGPCPKVWRAKLLVTRGVMDLGPEAVAQILRKVAAFDAFDRGNDPHGEHDFGAVEHGSDTIFWKIDLYEKGNVKGGLALPNGYPNALEDRQSQIRSTNSRC